MKKFKKGDELYYCTLDIFPSDNMQQPHAVEFIRYSEHSDTLCLVEVIDGEFPDLDVDGNYLFDDETPVLEELLSRSKKGAIKNAIEFLELSINEHKLDVESMLRNIRQLKKQLAEKKK